MRLLNLVPFLLVTCVNTASSLIFYTNSSTLQSASPSRLTNALNTGATGTTGSPTTANVSIFTAKPTSTYPIYHVTPNATVSGISSAMQCWSSIATWRNSSAIWWNEKIAGHQWTVTSFWSSTSTDWIDTATIYPSNPSTYKLCDGSARVDVQPKTTRINSTTTLFGSFTSTLMPTFAPQPCSLNPMDCRLIYHDTNVESGDDRELLRQCGNPAHLDDKGTNCLLGGGPVELIYFPVQGNNDTFCNEAPTNQTSPISARPMMPGLSEITTLGRTFTSDSVYLSFKTLYASYDGFWDKIGPTFSDYIVALHSTDVSTHCGGWRQAYGAGTQLDYADLNWPVPASAYKCQDRCAAKKTVSPYLDGGDLLMAFDTSRCGPEGSTIWSDVNPVLAVPTKIRDMVPEWSTCSFWNENIANFWFDPPIALQPASAAATPTFPSSPQTTPAAPSSTPTSPGPQSTRPPASPPSPTAAPSRPAESQPTHPIHQSDGEVDPAPPTKAASTSEVTPTVGAYVSSTGVQDSQEPSEISTSSSTSTYLSSPTKPFTFDPPETDRPTSEPRKGKASASPVTPSAAPAPAFSVLTEALSAASSGPKLPDATTESWKSTSSQPTSSQPTSSQPTSSQPTIPQPTIPQPTSSQKHFQGTETAGTPSGAVLGLNGHTVTAVLASDHLMLGSVSIPFSTTVTVSGVAMYINPPETVWKYNNIMSAPGAIDLETKTILFSALQAFPTAPPESPAVPTVMKGGGIVITASPLASRPDAVVVGGMTLSEGGPALHTNGLQITKGPDGILMVGTTGSGHITTGTDGIMTTNPPVPSIVTFTTLGPQVLYTNAEMTMTLAAPAGDSDAVLAGRVTLSRGGAAWTTSGYTYTIGPDGLVIMGPTGTASLERVTRAGARDGTTTTTATSLPAVVTDRPSATRTEAPAPTFTEIPTETETAGSSAVRAVPLSGNALGDWLVRCVALACGVLQLQVWR